MQPPRRPAYLVAALIVTLLFGAGCWTEGCGRLAFYRGETDQVAQIHAAIRDDGDRERVEGLYARILDVAEATKNRALPFAAATFVLGAALLAFASRGLFARSNARAALVQIVAVQAVVVVTSAYMTRELRWAERDWEFERALVHQHEVLTPEQYENLVPTAQLIKKLAAPSWLVFRTIASGLVLIALTRRRTREFFDAAAGPAPEQ